MSVFCRTQAFSYRDLTVCLCSAKGKREDPKEIPTRWGEDTDPPHALPGYRPSGLYLIDHSAALSASIVWNSEKVI